MNADKQGVRCEEAMASALLISTPVDAADATRSAERSAPGCSATVKLRSSYWNARMTAASAWSSFDRVCRPRHLHMAAARMLVTASHPKANAGSGSHRSN